MHFFVFTWIPSSSTPRHLLVSLEVQNRSLFLEHFRSHGPQLPQLLQPEFFPAIRGRTFHRHQSFLILAAHDKKDASELMLLSLKTITRLKVFNLINGRRNLLHWQVSDVFRRSIYDVSNQVELFQHDQCLSNYMLIYGAV